MAVEPIRARFGARVGVRVPRDPSGPRPEAGCRRVDSRRTEGRSMWPHATRCEAGFAARVSAALGTAPARGQAGSRSRAARDGMSGSAGLPAAGPANSARRRCRSAPIGSIVADPTTSATAGTARVARLRLRAARAAQPAPPRGVEPRLGRPEASWSSGRATAPPAAGAGAPKRVRGCSRNQSTLVSSHTSPSRQLMGTVVRVAAGVSSGPPAAKVVVDVPDWPERDRRDGPGSSGGRVRVASGG